MEEKEIPENSWLEKLERESWNLELLISGFSIFLLVQAYDGLVNIFGYLNMHVALESNVNGTVRVLVGMTMLASFVLTINLIVHVFLRGFWIGAVGLRSVQRKVDFEKLGYSDFFTKKLKERVYSIDILLKKLDTLSSVIFSFTFLIVFMFLSLFLFFAFLSLFLYGVNIGLDFFDENSTIYYVLDIVVKISVTVILFSGIIYAIDTLTLGFFKRYKWLSRIYFPIYKWMGVITMAGVYRSIYYSLISRFPKNNIRSLLLAYVMLFIAFPFVKFDQYIFYPDNGSAYKLSNINYDDQRNADAPVWKGSIPSQIVEGTFLPLFIRYNVKSNEVLQMFCEDFKPKKKDGFNSGIYVGKKGIDIRDPFVSEAHPEKALECLSNFYEVKIDSVEVATDFYFYIYPNDDERGIQTMLEIGGLSRGKHEIVV
ncbi:MAG TPA: hypothetical protein ENJ53_01305, partial [Phaeodactylibacter sp.]|nr:hypothetical protein [Phaeodactylibacter sp.]